MLEVLKIEVYLCLNKFCPIITECFWIMVLGSMLAISENHWMLLEIAQKSRNKHRLYYSKITKSIPNLNDHAEIFLGQLSISALMIKQQLRINVDYNSHITRALRIPIECLKPSQCL